MALSERLEIASRIAAGLFAGVPYGLDDFERTAELAEAEKKTLDAISRLSMLMADSLIKAEGTVCSPCEEMHLRFKAAGLSHE